MAWGSRNQPLLWRIARGYLARGPRIVVRNTTCGQVNVPLLDRVVLLFLEFTLDPESVRLKCRMAFVVIVIGGLVFGAGDQYLGTVHAMNAMGLWTESVSVLSAPWLILPFLVGWTQGRPRRAAVTGLVVTLSALAGYFAMTLSPMEGGHFSPMGLRALLGTNQLNEIGGLLSGPLFGWLGYRWHAGRSWVAAVLVTGALCLEPLAVTVAGRNAGRSEFVWVLEVVVGVVVGTWFFVNARKPDGMARRTSNGSVR